MSNQTPFKTFAKRVTATGVVAVVGVVLPVAVVHAAQPPIVSRSIEYHGGAAYEAARVRFELCSKSGCASVATEQRGGLYANEVTGPVRDGTRRVRISNESVARWEDGDELQLASDAEAQAMRDWVMQRVYFAFLPYRLADPAAFAEDLGLREWEGRTLRLVKVTFEPGSSTDAQDEFLYWFDPETARLELFAYSYDRNEGGLRFRKLFNYRRVNGLLFADQENWGVEGRGLSVDLVTPEYVRRSMRKVSVVEMKNIEVEPID